MDTSPCLQRAYSVEAFATGSAGRFFVGGTFLYFLTGQRLGGFALWGRPSVDDALLLNRVMGAALARNEGPRASLIEASALVGVSSAAFAAFASGLASRFGSLKPVILRQAIVRPSGLAGAVVAGFYRVLAAPYATAEFVEMEPALEWLGVPDATQQHGRLRKLIDAASGAETLLARLRHLLEESPGDRAELLKAAACLGVSDRTLQRRLREAGTTFQQEVLSAKVRLAKQLLLEGRLSVSAIANEVGCGSSPHLSRTFRKVTGTTPSAWRAHERRSLDA